jgi:uncharacterized alkaline shock family protein YloU
VSILVEQASAPGAEAQPSAMPPPTTVAPGLRGRTTVATSVVERVAGWVAATTPGVAAAELTGVRGWLSDDQAEVAEAHVETGEEGLHLALSIAVTYPEPVAEVAARVRERVSGALREQLAITTERIDVTVTELRHPRRDRVPLRGRVA